MSGQHRLTRLQLVNWGTFQGYADIRVPREGLLLTGPSGSGKSSVIDAIGAVLVQPRWLAFNAAAQEGGKGDQARSLVTYMRGAYKRAADEASGEVSTAFLRMGATWSGIALTYDDGAGAVTTLIRLMHLAGGTNTVSDVKSLFALAAESVDLMGLARYAENGLDKRGIKRDFPWQVDDVYQDFAYRLRKRLGLVSEQAQHLLHKTQSAKSLSSLDTLFREFMLDEPPTFDTARAAVDQFGELKAAHDSVKDARRQVQVLEPMRGANADRQRLMAERGVNEAQSVHLGTMLLRRKSVLAKRELAELEVRLAGLARQVAAADDDVAARQADRDAARDRVRGLGGADLERLQRDATDLQQAANRAEAERGRWAGQAEACGMKLPADEAGMDQFRERVAQASAKVAETPEERDALRRAVLAEGESNKEVSDLRDKLEAQARRRSNIEPGLLAVRDQLVALGIPADGLPFAGELIEVRPDQVAWTGAIERILRTFARTLLVPDEWYPLVSDYIDEHHLGTRVVYERVMTGGSGLPATPADSRILWAKLVVAPGPFGPHIRNGLQRFDYLCVGTAAELRGVQRGVTLAGQVRHSQTRHEKDDRFAVGDSSRWVLGSSTAAKQQALRDALGAATARHDESEAACQRAEAGRDERQRMTGLLAGLATIQWAAIDAAGPNRRLGDVRARIAALRDVNSGLANAEGQLQQAERRLQEARNTQQQFLSQRDTATERRTAVADSLAGYEARANAAQPVPQDVAEALGALFQRQGDDADEAERRISAALAAEHRRLSDGIGRAENMAVKTMTEYRQSWPAESSDLTIELDDLGGYLDILAKLRDDRLPEFEERFFELLQKQARNNVGEIAQQLRRARKEIRERVQPINESLRRTEYKPGGYLYIRDEDRRLPEVTQFLNELNEVTAGSLEDAFGPHVTASARADAERRFGKLEALMTRFKASTTADANWMKTVLDSRRHVQFTAEVQDENGTATDYYRGAGGLSGGERQKLVAFCLAAALRYQLARGVEQPGYGLVVLDEAFDKTDPAFTRMSLDVFKAFGFQLLLVTPEKMLQVMEDYVGGVAVVKMSSDEGVGSLLEVMPWEDDPARQSRTEEAPPQSEGLW